MLLNALVIIAIMPGGFVSDESIRRNMKNAYRRFFMGQAGIQIRVLRQNVEILPWSDVRFSGAIESVIDSMPLSRKKSDCIDYNLDSIGNYPNATLYLVSDLNPCHLPNIRQINVSRIVPIGMGSGISERSLERMTKGCSPLFGCLKGLDYMKL